MVASRITFSVINADWVKENNKNIAVMRPVLEFQEQLNRINSV